MRRCDAMRRSEAKYSLYSFPERTFKKVSHYVALSHLSKKRLVKKSIVIYYLLILSIIIIIYYGKEKYKSIYKIVCIVV